MKVSVPFKVRHNIHTMRFHISCLISRLLQSRHFHFHAVSQACFSLHCVYVGISLFGLIKLHVTLFARMANFNLVLFYKTSDLSKCQL